jgi:hypothetical protein
MLRCKDLRAALDQLQSREPNVEGYTLVPTRKGHVRAIVRHRSGATAQAIFAGSGSDSQRGTKNGIAEIRRQLRAANAQAASARPL